MEETDAKGTRNKCCKMCCTYSSRAVRALRARLCPIHHRQPAASHCRPASERTAIWTFLAATTEIHHSTRRLLRRIYWALCEISTFTTCAPLSLLSPEIIARPQICRVFFSTLVRRRRSPLLIIRDDTCAGGNKHLSCNTATTTHRADATLTLTNDN